MGLACFVALGAVLRAFFHRRYELASRLRSLFIEVAISDII